MIDQFQAVLHRLACIVVGELLQVTDRETGTKNSHPLVELFLVNARLKL
jgi:hypothetical protein